MVLVMSAAVPGPAAEGTTAAKAMPGMEMTVGGGVSSAPATWVVVVCGSAAAAYFGAALCWFYALIHGPRRPLADVLMTAGMGVAFAAIVA